MIGREMTDRIGAGGIAGELEGLAAAAAEVELAPVAAPAGVRHPVRPAEALEEGRLAPDPGQGVLAHAGPRQRQGVSGRARQDVAVGHHGELPPSPAAHAGLGIPAVVVGQDIDDLGPPLQPGAGLAHHILGPLELGPARQEPVTVTPRPAVVLGIGQLDAVGPEFAGQLEEAGHPVDVAAVQDHVQRERPAQLLHQPGGRQLPVEGARAGDTVGQGRLVGLDADLHVIEPRVAELPGPAGREAEPARDEVRVQAQAAGGTHDAVEVPAQQRLAAGEVELQDAQLPALGQHPLPFRRGQLLGVGGQVERVGTVRAVQRAAVGEFGQQAERPVHRPIHRRPPRTAWPRAGPGTTGPPPRPRGRTARAAR